MQRALNIFVAPSRRRVRRAGAEPVASSLELVLVDYFTRDGSTLLMRLLSSSPQIAVGGPYPFECRYFAYLWRWAHLLDAAQLPERLWSNEGLAALSEVDEAALIGPPPWPTRDLLDIDDREPASAAAFKLAWAEFAERATIRTRLEHRAPSAQVRYYAEKQMETRRLDRSAFPPHRVIATVRDPRDTYMSVLAWNSERGGKLNSPDVGDERDFVARYVARQRDRLRWIARVLEDDSVPVVRYEDLVAGLPGVADRLGGLLGVELSAEDVARDRGVRRQHVTAEDAGASVGRWRTEMDPDLAASMTRDLKPELAAVGFEV